MSDAAIAPKPKTAKAKTPAAPKAATPKAATPAAPKPSKSARPAPAGPVVSGKIAEAMARNAADTLKQVSDPTRLQVVLVLAEGPQNVTDLCIALGGAKDPMSQPALSHHLALMRHGRLVVPVRSGKHNNYELTDSGKALAKVVKGLVANGGF